MKAKPQPADAFQLFQAHFKQILNPAHPLIQLADQIDWARFDAAFADCYSEDLGAPAKATRLMVGLAYLKYAFDESDESVVERWVENPYWQYFCGFVHMQHEAPIDPSSLSRWRKRVGAERLALLLRETVELAVREKHLPKQDLRQVTVDTTVQEKNITYPTDSKLLYTAICKLGHAAKAYGVTLRQSYIRVGKRAATKAGRYAHAQQFRRMRRELKRLRTWVGRLIRDIRRKAGEVPEELEEILVKARRIRNQRPRDSKKLYSWHEPQVQCISKGKARQRYEFGQKVALSHLFLAEFVKVRRRKKPRTDDLPGADGQKVALATTNRSNWIVAAKLLENNPYDGHTLAKTLAAAESITGVEIADAYVDKGYRGHGCRGSTAVNIAGTSSKHLPRGERKRRRRRSAIEPKIGHLKNDHRVRRCFLTGLEGDAINIVLAAAAANLRKLLGRLCRAPREWLLRRPSLVRSVRHQIAHAA